MSLVSHFQMRRATPADDGAIVRLLSRTLGWVDDQRHRALFAWKHRDNPFGASPGWVAFDEEGLVGSRVFMRWLFRIGDQRITAVRAVDTATHPRAQGRGVFRALTLLGVEELTAAGVDWVFNTPNDLSAPGYVSMGWQLVGRLPIAVRPVVRGLPHLASSSRRPADLWSLETSAGEDAAAVLDDAPALEELAADIFPAAGHVGTDRTPAYLRWRYGGGPVGYRAVLGGASVRDGVVFFRLRRRGRATEGVIADVLAPGTDPRVADRLCRRALQSTSADYWVAVGSARPRHWVPIPAAGPLLTWRALARDYRPTLGGWGLGTGDVELF